MIDLFQMYCYYFIIWDGYFDDFVIFSLNCFIFVLCDDWVWCFCNFVYYVNKFFFDIFIWGF